MAAQTGYEYDTYTGTHRAALVSYGGSGLPGYNGGMLSVTARGNVTATSRYLNTTGSNVTTYAQYDVFGNVVAAVDGNVNTTSYAYSGAYGYGFPTMATYPTVNGITQSTSIGWDVSLGKPTGITEQYSGAGSGTISVTSASYGNDGSDLLDRLSAVTRGAGSTSPTVAAPAQTVYVYNDQPGALEVDACEDLNSLGESTGCAGGVKTARLFDGLGRTTEARTYEGSGYISVKTVYDGLGRVYQESNPYRPATDAVGEISKPISFPLKHFRRAQIWPILCTFAHTGGRVPGSGNIKDC